MAKNKIIHDQKTIDQLIDSFARTTDEIFSLQELKKFLLSGKQLRMKYGVDVTAPDIHIGHAVNLWMYRKLQELGHKIVFLIGDFTTQIGDPTGKNKTRPLIPESEIKKNSQAFIDQATLVLKNDPDLFEIRRNSEWFDKMPAKEMLSLMSTVTHKKLLAREMFRKRIENGEDIYEHELIYPILQGYDSVVLESDLTIIGTDQLYNEMMGKFFQEKFNQLPQVIITTKITPGIDGGEKQSKSLGNFVGLAHSPREKFGRIMSMADNLIIEYFKVYTDVPLKEISEMEKDLLNHPMEYKLALAKEIVKRYHGDAIAQDELDWFKNTFSEKNIPEDMLKIYFEKETENILEILKNCFESKKSNSDLRRLIQQGAVKANEEKISDEKQEIKIGEQGVNIKVGKRSWFKILKK